MSIIKRAYADTPSGQIHYRYLLNNNSTKRLPIVFIHMSASSSFCWEPLMRQYAPLGYSCYAVDIPGFGSSYDPVAVPDTAYYVHIFADMFKSLGLFSTGFHLMGHHSGACLSLEMAVLYLAVVQSIALIGPVLLTAEERAQMKAQYYKPFNQPVPDGSHLAKTWKYLGEMGCSDDLDIKHQEVLDHARAWKGRTQIYGAVWQQDGIALFMQVKCPILALCAKDDVLWPYFYKVEELRPEVMAETVSGGNFEPDRDAVGIAKIYTAFLNTV
ncbi:hypothetical protein LOCC1_G002201 [Lachnellula occidentalis]|uniref:AB hydrolase-1 domain-containing protein n=1 Tax=Lachnellula occidentalis TaxID=215460 RepID=A0A8H8S567_9HELO|nr:hypothetical protein LOCC1_G002201 [Lachnellula occidentalis]